MKIFGIGLNGTGTTSLADALAILGYKTKHSPKRMIKSDEGQLSADTTFAQKYDALVGTPIPLFYKELDGQFKGSKFILTVRDVNQWAESVTHHYTWLRKMARKSMYGSRIDDYLSEMYGSSEFNLRKYIWTYHRHVGEVRSYFQGREQDLLILNICGGEGWDKLCPMLDKPIPNTPFPRSNDMGSLRNYVPVDLTTIVSAYHRVASLCER